MLATSIIEVAIGLIFVYLLLSLVCSAANEIIESYLKNRATDLERGIRELFNQTGGGGLAAQFYNHPMINGLFLGAYGRTDSGPIGRRDYLKRTNLPTYIPARNFAYAILDVVLHPQSGEADVAREEENAAGVSVAAGALATPTALPVSMDAVRLALRKNLGSSQAGRALRTVVEQSGDDVNALRQNIETWFNGSMDRVSGHYKRRTQWTIFALGFILTVFLNVNTVVIARRLSTDSTLRSVVVAQAEGYASRADALKADFDRNREELAQLGLPIGWQSGIDFINPLSEKFNVWDHVLLPMLGWLLTAAAISLGAPFWFDLLNKFMVIRSTVKPHEKSLEEGSEDRQPNGTSPPAAAGGGPSGSTSTGGFNYAMAGHAGFLAIPEPDFAAMPDPEDNESHIDEGEDPILDVTPDEDLPPAKGGVG